MPVLQQIKSDAMHLRNLIFSLRKELCDVIQSGVKLTGIELEEALELARESNRTELKNLELILESGIIPKKYHSIITKETYYPSEDELKRAEALPKASHTFFSLKKSRKKNPNQKNSHFTVMADDAKPLFSFFIEHKEDKKYPNGGFATKVKKGFIVDGGDEPKYAIKVYHQGIFNQDTIHELRIAMRAAYCYKKLGREGVAFRNHNKQYMVTEWLPGINLGIANQEQVQSMPISRRIVMAINLLRELNVLHKLGLIHNDIKPENVMVNFGKLNFVDLDSVRPKNEKPLYGTTPMFTPRYLPTPQMSFDVEHNPQTVYQKFNEQTDIFALGLTLIHLFQEIYVPQQENREINVNGGLIRTHIFQTFLLHHGKQYAEHSALQKSLKKMLTQDPDVPMTCEGLIADFTKILSTYPDYEQYLAEDKLVDLREDYTPEHSTQSFKEIEIELLGFNQRAEVVNKRLAM